MTNHYQSNIYYHVLNITIYIYIVFNINLTQYTVYTNIQSGQKFTLEKKIVNRFSFDYK